MKKYGYFVLGARQGEAAANDLAKYGRAKGIIIGDLDLAKAEAAARRLNERHGRTIAHSMHIDASEPDAIDRFLASAATVGRPIHGIVSAAHFAYNVEIAKVAIKHGIAMVDLGGNTAVVERQHELHQEAVHADAKIIPDCGMAPGFVLNIGRELLDTFAEPLSLEIYCGGLPQKPEGPLGYARLFSIKGLLNEYTGKADVIEAGTRTQKPCLTDREIVSFLGSPRLEASTTSGGLSRAPWNWPALYPSLETLSYKTLRYPGHWTIVERYLAENRLDELREMLAALPICTEDVSMIYVKARGKDKRGATFVKRATVIDRADANFTSMQRVTGFHASIALTAAVKNAIEPGVTTVEMLEPSLVISEMSRRNIIVNWFGTH